MTTPPYRFQRIDVKRMHEEFHGRVLLGSDMGLGKTFQSLLYAVKHVPAGNIIVVCPAHLKENWQREVSHHFKLRAEILKGTRPLKKAPFAKPRIWIVNYDILARWMKFLRGLKAVLLIIDEAHFIKNHLAKRTRAVKRLSKGIKRVIAMTGTPIPNRVIELWPVLNLVRPDKYRHRFAFAMRYTKAERAPWGWEFKGAKNVKRLRRKLRRDLLIRRRKQDVLKDLPPKIRSVVPLKISNRKEYDEACADFFTWLAKISKTKARRAMRAPAITRMNYLLMLSARLKLPSVISWVNDFLEESDSKLLLFAVHKQIIAELHEEYPQISLVVSGKTKMSERQATFDRFNKSKTKRILIGNIQAAGTGWNGKRCSHVAFAEMGWTPAEHTQCEDRLYGLKRGIKGVPLNSWYLVGRDTLEEDRCRLIQSKQDTISNVLDGKKVSDDLDIYSLLLKALLKKVAQ